MSKGSKIPTIEIKELREKAEVLLGFYHILKNVDGIPTKNTLVNWAKKEAVENHQPTTILSKGVDIICDFLVTSPKVLVTSILLLAKHLTKIFNQGKAIHSFY